MLDRYIIYVNDHTGYKILDVLYDEVGVQEAVKNLDANIYLSYIVIKHNIKENSKEVIDFSFLDYDIKKRRKKID